MAENSITIRITFKAGSAQLKNPEQEYEIAPVEFDKLISEMRATDSQNRPTYPIGVYEVMRTDGNTQVHTRLILRFADVLYIG